LGAPHPTKTTSACPDCAAKYRADNPPTLDVEREEREGRVLERFVNAVRVNMI